MVRRTPGPGQEVLDGMPAPVMPEVATEPYDPDRLRAFGSIPRLLGVRVELIGAETAPEAPELLTPDYVNASLYGADNGYSVSGLAVNATEYELLVRWPKAFEEKIEAKADKATTRTGTNPIRAEEKRIKSSLEAFRTKLPLHEQALVGLQIETGNLSEARRVVKAPGYNLTKPKDSRESTSERYTELELQSMFSQIWDGSLPNLLNVLAKQRKWNDEEKAAAAHTLKAQLFTGPQRDRVHFWNEKVDMAYMYGMRRRALFTQRTHKVGTELRKKERELARFYEDHGIDPI